MSLLENPEVKKTYDKCKYIVKVWEHQFIKNHKRVPSKLDIREAPSEVRHAYRRYFKLKTAALEESFMDVDGLEDDDIVLMGHQDAVIEPDTLSQLHLSNDNFTEEVPDEASGCNADTFALVHLCSDNQATDEVWGSHLNKQNVDLESPETKERGPSKPVLSISKKLFCGSKFTKHKRNPRKSLSLMQKKNTDSGFENSSSVANPIRSLCTFNSEDVIECLQKEKLDFPSKPLDPIGQIFSQPLPLNIVDSVSHQNHTLRKVDTGWLQRVTANTGMSLEGHSSHKITQIPVESIGTKLDYNSDDIISGSDEENDALKSSQPLHVAKKFRINLHKSFNQSTKDDLVTDLSSVSVKENITSNIADNITKIEVLPESVAEKEATSKAIKKQAPKKAGKKVKAQKSSKTQPLEDSPSLRRSSRKNKVKASFQELSSGEEDPFASDTDSRDPEYTPKEKNSSSNMIDVLEHKHVKEFAEAKKNNREKNKQNSAAATSKKKRKTAKRSVVTHEEKNEEEQYELEYNVKPRIVASRYSSIKSILKEKLKDPKVNSPKAEQITLIKDKQQQAKDKLEQKMALGNLNENYVTINLRKKVFVRGKKGHNFSKYKKSLWKSKKKALYGPDMDMGGCDGGKLVCFNCGQEGHFAQKCKATKGDALLPLAAEEEEECGLPSLEEATKMASESSLFVRKPVIPFKKDEENGEDEWIDDVDEDLLVAEIDKLEEHVKKLDVQEYMDNVKVVTPYYALKEDGSVLDTPQEVLEALEKFGHKSFRRGQEMAVMRILSGKSTLVTLSTGSGKSLCYQLPAYLYSQREPCISLVISPLVSLMEDQVTGIPNFLKAACLHTNQTEAHRKKIMEAITLGELNVLLISPEAIVAGEKRSGFGALFRKLPPIAFACIDEAHCVSQWSHNFRPSYLLICRVLRERLGVQTILGLTATATRATCESIVESLRIPDGLNGIITDTPLPDNLYMTVSKDANRDRALLNLLLSPRFKDCRSIIVYCTRRDECERIAAFLRTSLKNEKAVEESSSKKRKRVNLQAEPYHAGLSASRRRTVQKAFMSGELRIVVATVAFGMGINKSDIRAVIHFNMPNSFESYVQEVGRAGRDGLPAQCHVFLDSQNRDENELRRHIHANSIDRHVIRKLLQKIFIPCSCKEVCPKHEVAFSIEQAVRTLDITEENISTLLCYLELHENKYVELLNPAYTTCKVVSYGGPVQIRKAVKGCPPLAMALALYPQKEDNIVQFPVIDVASAMGWESGICKHQLKNLEWISIDNQPKRSNLSVEFSELGFRLLAPGNLSDERLDEALDTLHNIVLNQERKALKQLHAVSKVLQQASEKSYLSCLEIDEERSGMLLKREIRDYFNSADPLADIEIKSRSITNEEQLVGDIKTMVCMYRDNQFTGRALARLFQGIQSPNYPAVIWGRSKLWRSHLNEDFHEICRIATREIIKLR
ncbi:ATP-dependent DNA helicase Q4 [Euwallacea fornicatus]|uniref:ATP-dependent DNA helicase Q4 n=1 Tax=Euwallacea fornicatus TaxID=995702 RepID=UPI00338EAA52